MPKIEFSARRRPSGLSARNAPWDNRFLFGNFLTLGNFVAFLVLFKYFLVFGRYFDFSAFKESICSW